jgi:hypothetical protein
MSVFFLSHCPAPRLPPRRDVLCAELRFYLKAGSGLRRPWMPRLLHYYDDDDGVK